MIIGLCGRMNSGKGLAATYLKSEYQMEDLALADPIKVIVRVLFGIDDEILWGPSENRRGKVRDILQSLGGWARTVDPDVWTNLLVKSIQDGTTYTHNGIVIPDIRFPNEARILTTKLDAKIIKIIRPDNYEGIPENQQLDASETSVDEVGPEYIHRTVMNDGPQEDFLDKIHQIMEDLIHESSNSDET